MSQDTTQLAPGLAQTASEVQAMRPQAEAAAAARQSQARAFQVENGAEAMTHTQVTAGQRTGG